MSKKKLPAGKVVIAVYDQEFVVDKDELAMYIKNAKQAVGRDGDDRQLVIDKKRNELSIQKVVEFKNETGTVKLATIYKLYLGFLGGTPIRVDKYYKEVK